MSLKDELIAYKAGGNPLKDRFLAFISDKSVPLDERWEAFKEAPSEFLYQQSWMYHFKSEALLPEKEIEWYEGGDESFYVERHQTVYMIDFLDDWVLDKESFTPEIIAAFKEEVLENAMESFEYDW